MATKTATPPLSIPMTLGTTKSQNWARYEATEEGAPISNVLVDLRAMPEGQKLPKSVVVTVRAAS